MLKTEAKTIGTTEFTTTQFPAMRAFALLAKLVKVAGPALGVLSSADPNTELADLAPVIGRALVGLDPDAASALVVEVLSGTTALVRENGGPRLVTLNSKENVDLLFSGKLKDMFAVLGHAIKVNYADFTVGSDPAAPSTPTLTVG